MHRSLVVLQKHSRIFGKIILPVHRQDLSISPPSSTTQGSSSRTETPPTHGTTRAHKPQTTHVQPFSQNTPESWQITRARRSVHPASAESPPKRHHPAHRIGQSPGFLPQLWGTPTFLTYARWDDGAWVATVVWSQGMGVEVHNVEAGTLVK